MLSTRTSNLTWRWVFLLTHDPLLVGVLIEGQQKTEAWPWSHSWVAQLWWTAYCVRNSASFKFFHCTYILNLIYFTGGVLHCAWQSGRMLIRNFLRLRSEIWNLGRTYVVRSTQVGIGGEKMKSCMMRVWVEVHWCKCAIMCMYGQAAWFIGVVQVDQL